MTKAKHTPGPWVLIGQVETLHGVDEYQGTVYQQTSPRARYRGQICRVQSALHMKGVGHGECQSNGRLIAAAPDLLAALKALLNGVTQHGMMADHGPALREAARAAIAKAEGRT